MKTILITIFQAVEAKNLLRTDVVKTILKDPDIRAVCLARYAERIPYYQKEFLHERILWDAFCETPNGFWERFFSLLKGFLIKTKTTDLRKKIHREESGSRIQHAASIAANWALARPFFRRIARFFDYHLVARAGYETVLKKYHPDVILLANLFDDAEIALLREAKKRKIPTIGFINSWDKLTARWALRLLPDKMAVFNEIVKREAMEHADMPEEKIIISGIPQYDLHINAKPVPREEFFAKRGLDPKKHLIVFAPLGPAFSDSDWEAIDMMYDVVSKEISNAQLLVRFQPNDFIDKKDLEKRPWLRYDLPGIRYGSERGGDWDMTDADLKHLTNTLTHALVVVSYPSSIGVDAALLGKPVMNIFFPLKPVAAPSKNPLLYYETEHYSKALAAGGIRLAKSRLELAHWIKEYIKNPSLDKEGRARLVAEQCWRTDGKSGERLGRVVLDTLTKIDKI